VAKAASTLAVVYVEKCIFLSLDAVEKFGDQVANAQKKGF